MSLVLSLPHHPWDWWTANCNSAPEMLPLRGCRYPSPRHTYTRTLLSASSMNAIVAWGSQHRTTGATLMATALNDERSWIGARGRVLVPYRCFSGRYMTLLPPQTQITADRHRQQAGRTTNCAEWNGYSMRAKTLNTFLSLPRLYRVLPFCGARKKKESTMNSSPTMALGSGGQQSRRRRRIDTEYHRRVEYMRLMKPNGPAG